MEHIKNESCKCYLDNKEQKAIFLVVSWSDMHVGFEEPFFVCLMNTQVKLRAQKIEGIDRNFSTTDIGQYVYCNCLFLMYWRRKFWNQSLYLHDQKFRGKI